MTPASTGVIRVAIADDEELARRHVRRLLANDNRFTIVGEGATGPETLRVVERERPDLLFLDIQMPGLDGFDVLRKLDVAPSPVVVFTTAYDEYALKAFEVCAIDYLLKPYTDDRFAEALRRAEEQLRLEWLEDRNRRLQRLLDAVADPDAGRVASEAPRAAPSSRIAVRTTDNVLFVPVRDIDWIEAAGDYVKLHVGKDTHLLRSTMHGIEQQLDPSRFVRIHRSTIVQVDRVKEMQPYFHGEYIVIMRDGTRVRLSRSYRKAALSALGIE